MSEAERNSLFVRKQKTLHEEQNMEISSKNSGLVIVDMQVEGCERHKPGVEPVIRNIRWLLDRARETGGNIIHIQSVRSKDHPEFTVFGKEYALLEETPGVDFVEPLRPNEGEPVVQKRSHDCFYQTSLERVLSELDLKPARDRIIVTGIGSNNCVYHTVIGFHVRNYFVVVPEDCIHASRTEGQMFALSQFRSPAYNFNVSVTSSKDIHLTASAEPGSVTRAKMVS